LHNLSGRKGPWGGNLLLFGFLSWVEWRLHIILLLMIVWGIITWKESAILYNQLQRVLFC
jgi:hypothetical protein